MNKMCSDPGCCIQTIQMDWVVLRSGFGCRSAVELWCLVISLDRYILCSSWNSLMLFGWYQREGNFYY